MAEPKTKSEHALLKAVSTSNIIEVKKLLNSNFTELKDERYFDYYLIMTALNNSQIDLAKLLIENGFRVHQPQVEKTILFHAVRLNDDDLVRILLEKGAAPDILAKHNKDKTPFHTAINKSQLTIIEHFCSHSQLKDLDKLNLLHTAVQQSKSTVVTKLVEKGLSLKKKNEKNLTPCCIAFNSSKLKIIDCLLSAYDIKNIDLNNYDDIALAYMAVFIGNLQVIKKFVDLGLSVNKPLKSIKIWSCLHECSGLTLLQYAVQHVNLEIVKFLLSKDADILVQNDDLSTPLHIAFETKEKGIWKTWKQFEDNNAIIDSILEANMKLKNNPVNKNGLSHFHVASSRDIPEVAEHFLKIGALINRPVSSKCRLFKGFTPLHFAAKFRCIKTLELLLKNGANVKQTNFKKETALHIAVKESSVDGVNLLLQYGADITVIDANDNSPVHLAYKKQNYAIIDIFLTVQNVADSNPANTEGLSHFHIACTRNNVDVVKRFIANGASVDSCVLAQSGKNKDTDNTYMSGFYPLHFAVYHNRAKIVELLLTSGANVKAKDNKGFTPLHIACRFADEMFREFIEVNLNDLNKRGIIALQLKSITDIVNVNEQYVNGFSGSICKENLDWTSNRNDHSKIIDLLLNTGISVNCIDNNGDAPLYYIYTEDTEHITKNNIPCGKLIWNQIVKDLTEELCERRELILNTFLNRQDVDLDKCYKNGSILNYICTKKDKGMENLLERLLKKGANVNVTNNKMLTPLHQVTLMGNKNLICLLLDYGANVDCINPKDNSTLLLSITSNEARGTRCINQIVKILIQKGANVNAKRSDGRTALHNLATTNNYFYKVDTVLCTLLKAGANINSRDSNGLTALHVACASCNDEAASALLNNGANINLEDNEGKTACCYFYEKHLKNFSVRAIDLSPYDIRALLTVLQNHIIKMNLVGLETSEKVLLSYAKFEDFSKIRRKEEKEEFVKKCKDEVQRLQDKKINDHCTMYSLISRGINHLSYLVKNSKLKSTIQSKAFHDAYPNCARLIQLKYQEGLDRAALLPTAKSLLNNLAGQYLPDACSEHICSYFTNFELKESVQALSSFLNCKRKISESDDNAIVEAKVVARKASKRQKKQ